MVNLKEEKQKIVILIILVVSTIIVLIISAIVKKNNEYKTLTKSVEEIGKQFYSEYIFTKKKDVIEGAIYKNGDITFSLNGLFFYMNIRNNDELNKSKLFSKCDLSKSIIRFTPHSSSEKQDFDVEVHLDCNL